MLGAALTLLAQNAANVLGWLGFDALTRIALRLGLYRWAISVQVHHEDEPALRAGKVTKLRLTCVPRMSMPVRSIGVVAKPNRSIRKRASHLPIEMAEVRRVGKPLRADNPPPESEEFESGPPVPSWGLIFVRPWEVHLRRDYDIPVEVYASGEYSPIVLSVKFTEAGPSEMVGMISLPVLGGSTQG